MASRSRGSPPPAAPRQRPRLVAPVVVVPQQRLQLGVPAEPTHPPHVAPGQVQRPRDPLVPQPVRVRPPRHPGAAAQGVRGPRHVAGVEPTGGARPGGAVQPHEQRPRPFPPRRDPVGQRRRRRRVERQVRPLRLPLADDGHRPGLQVDVAQVQRHRLAAAQAQVVHQPQQRQVAASPWGWSPARRRRPASPSSRPAPGRGCRGTPRPAASRRRSSRRPGPGSAQLDDRAQRRQAAGDRRRGEAAAGEVGAVGQGQGVGPAGVAGDEGFDGGAGVAQAEGGGEVGEVLGVGAEGRGAAAGEEGLQEVDRLDGGGEGRGAGLRGVEADERGPGVHAVTGGPRVGGGAVPPPGPCIGIRPPRARKCPLSRARKRAGRAGPSGTDPGRPREPNGISP